MLLDNFACTVVSLADAEWSASQTSFDNSCTLRAMSWPRLLEDLSQPRVSVVKLTLGEENMRSLTMFFALVLLSMAPGALAQAQDADASDAAPPTSASASKQEVNELRQEVIEQRKTIEELKAIVQKLAESKSQSEASSVQVKPVAESTLHAGPMASSEDGSAHLVNTVLVQPEPLGEAAMIDPQAPPSQPKKEPALTAGWNGEHFFIRSPDGQFSISPYG